MKSNLLALDENPLRPNGGLGPEGRILRLVKGGAERRAIEAGEIDAVMDPATGRALLLREAETALREAHVRSLLALSSDWCWEQDEFYRFISLTSAASADSLIYGENVIGKTLWDLPFDNMSESDWQTHRTLLEWRATFRDLDLRYIDSAGEIRWVSVSGEPTFDAQDQFKRYRGIMRDITLRKQSEALAQKPIRLACATLDALAVQVCVLDSTGTVIMANKPSGEIGTGSRGIGAAVPEGANYLKVCDSARGKERGDGVAIAAGIRQVIAGDRPLFRHEYVCKSPAGWCWFNLTVTVFPGDGAARVVVSRENVTGRKRLEWIPADGAARGVVSRNKKVAGRKRQEDPLGLEHNVAKGGPIANSLLAALPRKEYERLHASLELVTLTHGEALCKPGDTIQHVYFPNDCVVSLLATVMGGQTLEVGLVGREGMVGISLALGMNVTSTLALVQGSGTAMRMESARFHREFGYCPELQRNLYHHANAMLVQVRQTVACNRFHALQGRLARWLLMTQDRVQSDDLSLTHEFLSHMLGERREEVTKAAGQLKKRKLIEYRRGKIRILDRKGLETASCGCYEVVEKLQSQD